MRTVELEQIMAALDPERVMAALAAGFRAFAAGECQVAAVGHLGFPGDADCHIKSAHLDGDDVFAVKISNSFYGNPAGVPKEDGVIVVGSARTGAILAVLHDHGELTGIRTAMAGALAARLIAPERPRTLGVIGSGDQARRQVAAIRAALPFERLLVCARRPEAAAALGGEAVGIERLCAEADLIVTATTARAPLFPAALARPGMRIVAVGADAPGKQELDPELVAAATVIADSPGQCIDHGEAGWAVRAGLLDPARLIPFGQALAEPPSFAAAETVVVDLTGVAVQDVVIAKAVWEALAPA
ncbi:hypothetical protein M9978_05970 [Sphingomonas sp. MG17]|uniref:Ornithine cyclodeaminase n=1 Tax=Sphingomonas tagetis TaxID=2949092 RepID=A0A9X2KL22_9SPHN|nr:hypothetical protein [Sphingomonas tagetis]MCP3729971.1 hypothetical protein [Sphingomonas tagetis]